jgi:hypothetical protein
MSEVTRRFTLIVDQQVTGDLRRVKSEDSYAHAQIIAFLQELHGDQILCECLIDEHYSDLTIESIGPFWAMQSERLNIYRLKLHSVGNWRILTAGDHQKRSVAILVIMRRDQNYQRDADLIQRLKGSYEKLGYTELGR